VICGYTDPDDPETYLGAAFIDAAQTWSLDIPAMASSTTISFLLIGPFNAVYFFFDQTASASNADVSGITLSHSTTSVSGTVTNFTSPNFIGALWETSGGASLDDMLLGSTSTISESGAWEMVIDADGLPDDIHIVVVDNSAYFLANTAYAATSAGLSGLVLDKDEFSPWTPPDYSVSADALKKAAKAAKAHIPGR
jgi:hypothetical protein